MTRSRVNCLFGARIVAVGPYGRNAAKENADELNMTWNGIGCVMLNTRDTGRYNYGKDFRQDGPEVTGWRDGGGRHTPDKECPCHRRPALS